MKTAANYIDAIRDKYQLNSDRKAAALLGVTSMSVSRFRNGEDSFADATAAKVAELLDCDPEEVVISAHAERAKDDRTRAIWARLAKKAGYAAGIVAMTAGLGAAPSPAQTASPSNATTFCIMSTRRRPGFRPTLREMPALSRLFFGLVTKHVGVC